MVDPSHKFVFFGAKRVGEDFCDGWIWGDVVPKVGRNRKVDVSIYVFFAFLFTHFFGKNAIEKPKENWEVEREWKFFG